MTCDLTRATNGELHNILIATLWEARQDTLQQPVLRVPWSTRLSAFWDIYRFEYRASQTLFSKLIFMWLGIVIGLPVYLLLNIILIRRAAWWSLKLVARWAICLRDHHEQTLAVVATIRDRAQQQLPGLTDKEADWMVLQILTHGTPHVAQMGAIVNCVMAVESTW